MKFTPQHDQMDCGPACLSMVCSYYKKEFSLKYLRENSFITREGVSLLGIKEASEKVGFKTTAVKLDLESLKKSNEIFPSIIHWDQCHFVVLLKIKKNLFTGKYKYKIADPAHGIITLNEKEFIKYWIASENKGVALILEPTEKFYTQKTKKTKKLTFFHLLKHLKPYKKQLVFIFITLLLGSGLSLIFPFLTKYLIDKGINNKDIDFISLILFAQLSLFLGSLMIEVIRNWLILFIGTKISITIISDFLKKFLQLPIKFFDTKLMGDFRQRIQDNKRIEQFLTSESLLTFFSIITLSVFMGVLFYYDVKILLVYLSLTLISITWSLFWLKKRKYLDYFRFQRSAENQDSIYEILNGVTELKINQFEKHKISNWEKIQNSLFKINIRILKLDQIQISGFQFINQIKNILVTFLSATYVVYGKITLGELLSISYIIGQMNSPIDQILNFVRGLQTSKLSLERINEIQIHKPEDHGLKKNNKINSLIENDIIIENINFQYEGPNSPYVLKDINLTIPKGKITAIVGTSGSGKTTLIKLLMKFL